MKQSSAMALVEAVANVIGGYGVVVVTQLVVSPWYGLPSHLSDALAIGAVFTLVSILRLPVAEDFGGDPNSELDRGLWECDQGQ